MKLLILKELEGHRTAQQVIALLVMLAYNIQVSVQVLAAPLCFLLMCLGRQQKNASCLGRRHSGGSSEWSSWLLAFVGPNPGYCSYLRSESVDSGSHSVTLLSE